MANLDKKYVAENLKIYRTNFTKNDNAQVDND